MKMKKVQVFQLMLTSAIILVVGCSSPNKMLKNASTLKYDVTPNPLEMKGDSVEVTVSGNYPAKFFNKKAQMVVTPMLKWDNGSVNFGQINLQGEAVQGNGTTISYTNGGSFSFSGKVPYQAGMLKSELVINSKTSIKSKSVDMPEVKIADGVLSTAALMKNEAQTISVTNQLKRSEIISSESEILFPISQSVIQPKELTKAGMKGLKSFAKNLEKDTTIVFKNVEIHGFASPDGSEQTNTSLAQNRQSAAEKAIKKELNKNEVVGNFTAEDWEGFRALMQNSNIQDKDVILSVLSRYSDPIAREAEIKKMAVVYKRIADEILPKLRRSKVIVNAEKKGKTDEQLLNAGLAVSKDSLTEEEFLFTTTLASSNDDVIKILSNGVAMYPESWKLQNNLGVALIAQNKLQEATTALNKANELSEGDKAVKNNLGVIAVKQGDMKKAVELFEVAQGAGSEVKYNLGVIKLKQGDYPAAVAMFGSNATFNASLAKLLNGDVDGALSTITKAGESENASAYYLKAVIGARQKNIDMIVSNLKVAVEKDSSLRERAKKDLEFKAFAEDSNFKSILR
ncbi:MAG: Tetratricopeptide repeat protein [Bacteroidetes bacterium ADurb.Bin217]|nr:MAG: Tetratricopeptide repeat protein [Bacteroidetes bacterium ADurb.Bin217]